MIAYVSLVVSLLEVQVKRRINLYRAQIRYSTVLPAKSDSAVMFCLQSYQGLRVTC